MEDREVIKIDRNGTWWADGSEITHLPTLRAFQKHLKKEADGYWIVMGRERKKIEIEDTAFFVERVQGDPKRGFKLEISNGERVALRPETLKYQNARLTCWILLEDGEEEEVKFLRQPYHEFLQHARKEGGQYCIRIGKEDFSLGPC